MGLLDGTTQQQYYQGNEFGNYQFTSLSDIINQFMVAYVGEDKIISKIKRTDVAFHAQRAMQELSFDTFKSCKAQEITVPPNLQMILPQDYVNYTKITWVDSSGIEHIIYPISKTSNPFSILQNDDGSYAFPADENILVNSNFDEPFGAPWFSTDIGTTGPDSNNVIPHTIQDSVYVASNQGILYFNHHVRNWGGVYTGRVYTAWQQIDVSNVTTLELSATGFSVAPIGDALAGRLWFGLSTTQPENNSIAIHSTNPLAESTNMIPPDVAYLEWNDGASSYSTQSLDEASAVDVSMYDTLWAVVTSWVDFTNNGTTNGRANSIDNLFVTNVSHSSNLLTTPTGNSNTWDSYSSATPSENQDDYQDDNYWPANGERYGLDPQFAQTNGSFYIDCHSGKIHFSSNIAGKTIILHYISDSLGTDEEMQVHKFAEEAMYKYIAHSVLSTRANIPEYQVTRFKKEKFAAVRKAKLRLSNIKLEEITQIFRGKSKHIKH